MNFDDKIKNYIGNLKKEDRIAILYHSDVDGICSAVITLSVIEKTGKKVILFLPVVHKADLFSKELLNKLKENKINKVIMVDFSADQYPNDIKKIEQFSEILILDHHATLCDLNSEKTLFIKAKDYYNSETYTPCSKLCFDAFSKITNMGDLYDIMLIGFVSDSQFQGWEKEIRKKYSKLSPEQFMKVIKKLNNGVISKKQDFCLKILRENKNFHSLNKKLSKIVFPSEKDIAYHLKNWKKLAEINKKLKLAFLNVKSKYKITSTISTVVAYDYIDWVIITYQKLDNVIQISARRQDAKIKMNELLANSIKGFNNATAGGHIPAAGGNIQVKDLERFKQNVIKNLEAKI